ncbi:Uncharacterised protein [Neisseria meningitidis]|nr:Uncharacterised protein [Neisseria meningitidis]CWP46094.1 Uncharacterised protein [Neisseria meningitidis]
MFHFEGNGKHNQCLQHQQHCQQHQYLPPAADQCLNVQLHADRDKEKAEQNIAERADVVFDLETVFRFRKQHAGNECAQRHRQTFQLSQISHTQGYQQHIDHKEFGRFAFCHHPEPSRHNFAADEKQQPQRQQHFCKRQTQGRPNISVPSARQRGNQNHQRHDGDVLHQQHAHRHLTVRLPQFRLFRQNPAHNRRGRHRQRARHGKRPIERHARQHQYAHYRQHRNADLQTAQTEHQPPHRPQLGQRELQTDAEHQEHNPDFAQIIRRMAFRNQAEHTGPRQKAHQQVAQHGGNVELAAQDHRNDRHQQNNHNRGKRKFVHRPSEQENTEKCRLKRHTPPHYNKTPRTIRNGRGIQFC